VSFNIKADCHGTEEARAEMQVIRNNQYSIIKSVGSTVEKNHCGFNLDIDCPEKKYSDGSRMES
jgi:hypothetical protein